MCPKRISSGFVFVKNNNINFKRSITNKKPSSNFPLFILVVVVIVDSQVGQQVDCFVGKQIKVVLTFYCVSSVFCFTPRLVLVSKGSAGELDFCFVLSRCKLGRGALLELMDQDNLLNSRRGLAAHTVRQRDRNI